MKAMVGKNYTALPYTPYGNTLTAELAKVAVTAEKLGADDITDFLAISFSSPDYIGHNFGPNSIEAEDGMLRLDKELGELMDFFDKQVGKDNYSLFITADHGVVQVPEYLLENKLPAGRVFMTPIISSLNKSLADRYKIEPVIVSDENYQVYFNHRALDSARINKKELAAWIKEKLEKVPGIFRAFPLDELNTTPLPAKIREMVNNGYFPGRNGDIQVLLYPNYIDAYSSTGTTHGIWNSYDSHIPLLWYGWGIRQGSSNKLVHITDIAATVSALLHIESPNGSIGNVIEGVLK
jgi:arylsulfatase A-like enzyme